MTHELTVHEATLRVKRAQEALEEAQEHLLDAEQDLARAWERQPASKVEA